MQRHGHHRVGVLEQVAACRAISADSGAADRRRRVVLQRVDDARSVPSYGPTAAWRETVAIVGGSADSDRERVPTGATAATGRRIRGRAAR